MELYSLVFFSSTGSKQFITVLFFYNIALICDPKNRTSALLQITFVQRVSLCLHSVFTLQALNSTESAAERIKNKRREAGSVLSFGLNLLEVPIFHKFFYLHHVLGTIYSLCWGNMYYMCSLLSRISLKPLKEVQTVKKAWLCWALFSTSNADFFWPLSPLFVTITKITEVLRTSIMP